jgi:hypothetical protein
MGKAAFRWYAGKLRIRHPPPLSVKNNQLRWSDRMKRSFSAQQLYQLRNFIPIDVLIAEKLLIPCKQSDGHLRFFCPLCREFQTATMQKTNLARCFRCEKNFNTIDLVMLWQNTDFVQSAKFLTALLQKLTERKQGSSKAPTEAIEIGKVLQKLPCRLPER